MGANAKAQRDAYVSRLKGEIDLLATNPNAIRFPLLKVLTITLFNLLIVAPFSVVAQALIWLVVSIVAILGLLIGCVLKLVGSFVWTADFIVVTCWYGWNGTKIILRGKE